MMPTIISQKVEQGKKGLVAGLFLSLAISACTPSMERRGTVESRSDTISDTLSVSEEDTKAPSEPVAEDSAVPDPIVDVRPRKGPPEPSKSQPERMKVGSLTVRQPVSGAVGVQPGDQIGAEIGPAVGAIQGDQSAVKLETPSVVSVLWESSKEVAAATKDLAIGMTDVIRTKSFWLSLPKTWKNGLTGLYDSSVDATSDWFHSVTNYFRDKVRGPRFFSSVETSVQNVESSDSVETNFLTADGFTRGRCMLVSLNEKPYIVAILNRELASGKFYDSRLDQYTKDIQQTLVLQFEYRVSQSVRQLSAAVVSFESRQLSGSSNLITDPFQKTSNSNQKLTYVDSDLDGNRLQLETSFNVHAVSTDGRQQIQVAGNFRCKFSSTDVIQLD